MKKGQTHIQKSWDQVGIFYYQPGPSTCLLGTVQCEVYLVLAGGQSQAVTIWEEEA